MMKQTVDSTKIETYFKGIEPKQRTQSLPIEITSRKPVIALKFMIDQDQMVQTLRIQLFFKDTSSFNQCLDLIQDSQLLDPSLQMITSQLPLTFLTQDIDGGNSNSLSNSNIGDPQETMSYSTRSTFWEPQFQASQSPPDLRKIILLKLQDPNFVEKVKLLEDVISDVLI
ncbi:Hypothetical protein KP2612_000561 [Komagataella phaffii]|uniref:Uncharacterized protein n=1 Tax=Komagataella phaffii (strain GS115 / ATCC 20864) TaxID=644223 RepID=C4QWG9_KOMPG|nr:Hypothetical protein PAS_chr1-1_0223 [Komagataella phaffii GS115]AOA61607.1 GQ67_02805T0 [Komagataella phaffii]AOA66117.1 GQ68_02443T0 [Komagataella phaffii GS115]CAY67592.1 Hypothetical protein PAS_chr1-1_0223 [Komagataella phaffii GS115]